jgi:hypothetical protein
MKLKLPPVKPRNPVAVPASQRKAGTHKKSGKAQRQADKRALKKEPAD